MKISNLIAKMGSRRSKARHKEVWANGEDNRQFMRRSILEHFPDAERITFTHPGIENDMILGHPSMIAAKFTIGGQAMYALCYNDGRDIAKTLANYKTMKGANRLMSWVDHADK